MKAASELAFAADFLEAGYPAAANRLRHFPALLEALEELYAEQNGPPLIQDAAKWEAAMTKAQAAIKAAREG